MRTERVVTGVRPDVVAVDQAVIVALERDRGQALFGFARRLGLGDEQAADAVQETLLRLWRELTRGITVDDPAAWSFRTLYRICMDEHRLRRRVAALADRMRPPASAPSPAEGDERRAVWSEVDRLPTRQRNVLYLRYRADLPFEQVATVLGISSGAARTLASRALDRLRERLVGWEGQA